MKWKKLSRMKKYKLVKCELKKGALKLLGEMCLFAEHGCHGLFQKEFDGM